MVIMLASQLKTLPEPAVTPINAKRENIEENISAVTGSPFRRVFLNMEGAFPAIARPSVRYVLGNGVRGFMPSR